MVDESAHGSADGAAAGSRQMNAALRRAAAFEWDGAEHESAVRAGSGSLSGFCMRSGIMAFCRQRCLGTDVPRQRA
ncbi:hypothetical protein Y886_33085 [Xanthomonas hyacinthi DSM 19077]|nr:hypothetical protein Y886_33085 [Xanthomonas hyacinthi DSM 19077]